MELRLKPAYYPSIVPLSHSLSPRREIKSGSIDCFLRPIICFNGPSCFYNKNKSSDKAEVQTEEQRGPGLSVSAKLVSLLRLHPVVCVTLGRLLNSFILQLLYTTAENSHLAAFLSCRRNEVM